MTLKEFTKLAVTAGWLNRIGMKSLTQALQVGRKMPASSTAKMGYLADVGARHSNFFGKVKEEYGPLGRTMKKGKRLALHPELSSNPNPAPGLVPGAY